MAFDKLAPSPIHSLSNAKRTVNSPTKLRKTPPPPTNNHFSELEIDGLVLDETRSKLARDFYEIFYQNWSSLNVSTKGQIIVIREQPAIVGFSTNLIVEVNDNQITQFNLRPGAGIIEDTAGQLVKLLENHLNNSSKNSVIDRNDLTGSGLF